MTRKALVFGIFACTAFLTAGCASNDGGTYTGQSRQSAAGGAMPSSPVLSSRAAGVDAERFFTRTGAAYRHIPSNMTCGDTLRTALGPLMLETIVVNSADGSDITCSYGLGGGTVFATMHARHQPTVSLRAVVQDAKTKIAAEHGNHAAVRDLYPLEVKPGVAGGADVGSFGLLVSYPAKAPFRAISMTSKIGDWIHTVASSYPDTGQAQRYEQDLRTHFAARSAEIRGKHGGN